MPIIHKHFSETTGHQRLVYGAVSMLALGVSWLLMQTIFAFRYAHLYYQKELRGHPLGAGLVFPGQLAPDYFDFWCYAYLLVLALSINVMGSAF